MSTTYQTVGQAIFDLIAAIDIADIAPGALGGWRKKTNYPPKRLSGADYPAFAVVPAEDAEDPLDSISDDDRVTYWVFIYANYLDASDGEAQIRRIVDRVRTEVRKQKRSVTPLGNGAYALARLSGAWGGNVEEGERFYRLTIEIQAEQSLI